jgi:threonine 3-dehydrogenase
MLTIKGIYGYEIFETLYKIITLVQSELDLTDLITHRIDVYKFESRFAAVMSGEAGKVVMDWG